MRRQDQERVFEVNLAGTRNVLEVAADAGVERVVHTSSAGAIGPAERGRVADETQAFTAGGLGIAYVNSKHEAEVEALRLAARGLDVVIVNPTFVLGPDAPSGTSMALVRRFLLRRIPAYVDGGLNIVDVRDVAVGMVKAAERDPLVAEGVARPHPQYIYAGMGLQRRVIVDMLRTLRELAGGAFQNVPSSEASFAGPETRADTERYFQSATASARERLKLIRLLWDFVGTEFAGRQLVRRWPSSPLTDLLVEYYMLRALEERGDDEAHEAPQPEGSRLDRHRHQLRDRHVAAMVRRQYRLVRRQHPGRIQHIAGRQYREAQPSVSRA